MNTSKLRFSVLSAGLFGLFALSGLTGCGMPRFEAKETRKSTVPSTGQPVELTIETQNGQVSVTTEPELSEVQIEATIVCRGETQAVADDRLAKTELLVESSGNTLKITTEFPGSKGWGDGASITVKLPALDSAKLESSNGSITVDGSKAAVNGQVTVDTSNGSVRVQRISGNLTARSSNASITASDIGGTLDLDTSNGKIDVTLLDSQQGPISADTSNASIQLQLPKDFQGVVQGSTSNAKFKVDDPGKVASESEVGKSIGKVSLGQSNTVSKLDTSNGGIEVKIAQ